MSDTNKTGQEASDEILQQVHAELMENKEEPETGFSRLPIAILFVAIVLSFVGGIYLIEHSGGFDPLVYDAHTSYEAGSGGPVIYDLPAKLALGEKVYKKTCLACHQPTGAGVPGAYPTLRGTTWVNGSTERFAAIIINGLVGEIEVNGSVYNNNMTAHGFLSDKEIAAVMTYVRSVEGWENNSEEVFDDTVASVRAAEGSRSSQWTAAELLEIWAQ